VTAQNGLETTIDWLLANRPPRGGELERQIGDPFDYEREDALLARWRATAPAPEEAPLPEQGHQYRHPRAPGEAWSAGRG